MTSGYVAFSQPHKHMAELKKNTRLSKNPPEWEKNGKENDLRSNQDMGLCGFVPASGSTTQLSFEW